MTSLASVAKGPITIAGHLQEAPRINIISIQHPVAHYHLNKGGTFARLMLVVLFTGCLFLSYHNPSASHLIKHLSDIFQSAKVVPSKVSPED